MNREQEIFLNILKLSLQGRQLTGDENITAQQWEQVLQLAKAHNVLPLIYNASFSHPNLANSASIRSQVRQLVILQAVKTNEFIQLYEKLTAAGCMPLVVKGLVCRNLYSQPDLRLSTDEDILVPAEQVNSCYKVFKDFGMHTEVPEEQFDSEYEIPFRKKDGVLYVEMHKSLFPPQSQAYGDWNNFFENLSERAVEDNGVLTLSYTDHLMYLICHAFKHFLHSGFGIRQVCDIVMYANAYGHQIDWKQIYDNCTAINAQTFAATLFVIGEKYLVFDSEKACYPQYWHNTAVSETNMLTDLLSAGVFGGADMSRRHSSNMTLDAVMANKRGKKAKTTLKGTLFPSAEKLQSRYPYLQKKPYLLPKAWVSRGVSYLKETKNTKNNSVAQALKIGSDRIELLREYNVIK